MKYICIRLSAGFFRICSLNCLSIIC